MQIALVMVSSDSNRGACALTWASLDMLSNTFPGATIAIVPIAETPANPAGFRHTMRRYPDIAILPPLFDGQGRAAFALICRLTRSLSEIFRFARRRRNHNPTLEWIRNCDLVVAAGGVKFETSGGTLRDDARFVVRSLPVLAAQKIGIPTVFLGAQVGPFNTWFGGRWFARLAAKAAAAFPRDHVSASEIQRRVAQACSILMPDSAFALKLRSGGVNELFERRGLDVSAATLALVISRAMRPNEPSADHLAIFSAVAVQLVASGLFNQIIVVAQADEDWPLSRQLAQQLGLDARFLIDDDLDPDQLSAIYGACGLVVSSRLHAVILAMLAGAPAISLAPEVTFKEHAVLDLLGLTSLHVPTRSGSERAARICLDIVAELDQHRQAVVTAVGAAQAQLAEVPCHLREAVATDR